MTADELTINCWVASSGGRGEGPAAGAFRIAHEARLIAVADAVGLRAREGRAAHQVVQTFVDQMVELPLRSEDVTRALQAGFQAANLAVLSEEPTRGLAAVPDAVTLVAVVFRGAKAVIASVGNSRCYRARAGTVTLLTRDHSAVAELRGADPEDGHSMSDPFQTHHRNLLTRALGIDSSVMPDITARNAPMQTSSHCRCSAVYTMSIAWPSETPDRRGSQDNAAHVALGAMTSASR